MNLTILLVVLGIGFLVFPYLGEITKLVKTKSKDVGVPAQPTVENATTPVEGNLNCLIGLITTMKGNSEEREYLISKVLPKMVREKVDE